MDEAGQNSSKEEWQPVRDFEHYEISTHGRLRVKEYTLIAKDSRHRKGPTPRTYKARDYNPAKYQTGYLVARLCGSQKRRTVAIHTLVVETFLPKPDPKRRFVNHKDGNKLNNAVDNLEWTTPAENTAHAVSIGLINVQGTANPAAKHSAEAIGLAKALTATGLWSDRLVGEYLGMRRETVKNARLGKNWRSVPATKLNIVKEK